jgi:hypothetical protein
MEKKLFKWKNVPNEKELKIKVIKWNLLDSRRYKVEKE